MANSNSPQGFRPFRLLDGSPWDGGKVEFAVVPASSTNAVFMYDAVTLAGGRSLVTAACEVQGLYRPKVVQSAASDTAIFGIVVGIAPLPFQLTNLYVPASSAADTVVMVVTDPNMVFKVQSNGATGTALANSTKNFNFTTSVAGSTLTGISGMQIDDSTDATTSTLPFKCVGYADEVDNVPATQYNDLLVILNNSAFKAGTAGV